MSPGHGLGLIHFWVPRGPVQNEHSERFAEREEGEVSAQAVPQAPGLPPRRAG